MTINEIKKIRIQKGYTFKRLSYLSRISVKTIRRIFNDEIKSPEYEMLQTLEHILGREEEPGFVRESPPHWKEQGSYSLKDYYALPDERRVELIDGVFYDMASPGGSHQIIAYSLSNLFYHYIREKGGGCRMFIAPLDVQLDCDDKTMVQPDLIVLCDMKKYTERCIMGAPDFLAEVLSPGTRKKDMTVKLRKYRTAGVKEYWMIDLEKECVIVYDFENNQEPVIYGFDSKIPVGIYQGELIIDFEQVSSELIMH